MHSSARRWLRFEGAAVLAASVLLFARGDVGWWLFFSLFFVPDLAMLGYLGGPRVGAWTYNVVHSYVLPILLATAGTLAGQPLLVALGRVGTAHIGFDRMLGYGLKLPDGFRAMHLGPIGEAGRVKA